jgi:hypothetical protein
VLLDHPLDEGLLGIRFGLAVAGLCRDPEGEAQARAGKQTSSQVAVPCKRHRANNFL